MFGAVAEFVGHWAETSDLRKSARGVCRALEGLGAASDDPAKIIKVAIEHAEAAIKANDTQALREAAELGWLAMCGVADVAAHRLERGAMGGFNARRAFLVDLTRAAGVRLGDVVGSLEAARSVLHGDCFHSAKCEPARVLTTLEIVRDAVLQLDDLVARAQRRARKSARGRR